MMSGLGSSRRSTMRMDSARPRRSQSPCEARRHPGPKFRGPSGAAMKSDGRRHLGGNRDPSQRSRRFGRSVAVGRGVGWSPVPAPRRTPSLGKVSLESVPLVGDVDGVGQVVGRIEGLLASSSADDDRSSDIRRWPPKSGLQRPSKGTSGANHSRLAAATETPRRAAICGSKRGLTGESQGSPRLPKLVRSRRSAS